MKLQPPPTTTNQLISTCWSRQLTPIPLSQAERKLQQDDLEDRLEDLEQQNEEQQAQVDDLESKYDEVRDQ